MAGVKYASRWALVLGTSSADLYNLLFDTEMEAENELQDYLSGAEDIEFPPYIRRVNITWQE